MLIYKNMHVQYCRDEIYTIIYTQYYIDYENLYEER